MAVDLSHDEALEASEDVLRLEPFEGASCPVVAGARFVTHADQHDGVQRTVGLAVSAAVESMAVGATGDLGVSQWASMISGHARVVPMTDAAVEVPVVPAPAFR
ncbi:hypothetical protein ASD51_26325 [Streptomyces sp. Root55]|nr:hypothetical protein ASD51_26325 [Streptomyces sp. Root55]